MLPVRQLALLLLRRGLSQDFIDDSQQHGIALLQAECHRGRRHAQWRSELHAVGIVVIDPIFRRALHVDHGVDSPAVQQAVSGFGILRRHDMQQWIVRQQRLRQSFHCGNGDGEVRVSLQQARRLLMAGDQHPRRAGVRARKLRIIMRRQMRHAGHQQGGRCVIRCACCQGAEDNAAALGNLRQQRLYQPGLMSIAINVAERRDRTRQHHIHAAMLLQPLFLLFAEVQRVIAGDKRGIQPPVTGDTNFRCQRHRGQHLIYGVHQWLVGAIGGETQREIL